MAMHINPEHKGLFHKDVGRAQSQPISGNDLMKGLHSKDPAVRKRANFARMAKRHFKPLKKST